uniref:Uncharacterized protein n=1 Tax=Trichogramma kaykai TaxID=54128 RepID=A0ABD2WSC3_9HYME
MANDITCLRKLKIILEDVDWEIMEKRRNFLSQLYLLITNWNGQYPDLRTLFRPRQIDWLITQSVKANESEILIDFVIKAGYKDEPDFDKNDKPSLHRTTPVHYAAKLFRFDINYRTVIRDLFKIYNRSDMNYICEWGFTHFHVACEWGFEDVVQKFLHFGHDPNLIMRTTGNSLLHLAADWGSKDLIELLLKYGADPNRANKAGSTPLHTICKKNYQYDLTEVFFKVKYENCQQAQVDVQDWWGNTPLHYALLGSNNKVIESLLKRSVNPNLTNQRGLTYLHMICKRQINDGLAEFFFKIYDDKHQTVEVDAQDPFGNTPLHLALQSWPYTINGIFELLLRRGANPNLAALSGLTPLHIICQRFPEGLVEKFFNICDESQLAVQMNARDAWHGYTPLHFALVWGHRQVAELLLRRGADPNMTDKDGSSPLHISCMRNKDYNIVTVLFEVSDEKHLRVQVNAQDNLGRTPLHLALYWGQKKVVELLLKNGADPNMPDEEGLTALHVICQNYFYYNYDLAKLFFSVNDEIQQTVQVDARDYLGRTPLHLALSRNCRELSRLLLSRGADPNAINAEGLTPLRIVCKKLRDRSYEWMEVLFNHDNHQRVRIDALDELGRTTLQWAVANLWPHVVDVLLDHGADISNFVFPNESHFDECVKMHREITGELKLQLTAGALMVIERLEDRGYKLNRSDALTIMKFLAKHGVFEKSMDLDNCLFNDEQFTSRAKKIRMNVSLSLYGVMRLQPEEVMKIVTYEDFFKFVQTKKLSQLLSRHHGACAMHLCEKLSRGFFQRWALEFLNLPKKNEDLFRMCLAAENVVVKSDA